MRSIRHARWHVEMIRDIGTCDRAEICKQEASSAQKRHCQDFAQYIRMFTKQEQCRAGPLQWPEKHNAVTVTHRGKERSTGPPPGT